MTAEPDSFGLSQAPLDSVVHELIIELGRAFDLGTPLGTESLGGAVERRIRSLRTRGAPAWGTDESLTQLAKKESGALDFYFGPHLFPEMDPALRLGHGLQFDLLPRDLPAESPLRIAAVLESWQPGRDSQVRGLRAPQPCYRLPSAMSAPTLRLASPVRATGSLAGRRRRVCCGCLSMAPCNASEPG